MTTNIPLDQFLLFITVAPQTDHFIN